MARDQDASGRGPGSPEALAYAATVAVPLLVGLATGVVVLLATRQTGHRPFWAWQVGAAVAATTAASVLSYVRDRRRTARALDLAGGARRAAHVEALLRRGLHVPEDARGVAGQVAGAQLESRWLCVVLPVFAVLSWGTAWTNHGLSFWLALALPVLLLPGWALDLRQRRGILRSAADQGIVPRPRARTAIPW